MKRFPVLILLRPGSSVLPLLLKVVPVGTATAGAMADAVMRGAHVPTPVKVGITTVVIVTAATIAVPAATGLRAIVLRATVSTPFTVLIS